MSQAGAMYDLTSLVYTQSYQALKHVAVISEITLYAANDSPQRFK